MRAHFNHRIKTYIFFSVLLLLVVNFFITTHLINDIDRFIDSHSQYSAVEIKNSYEKIFELQAYYSSNYSEYSRYHVEQWYKTIEIIYRKVLTEPSLEGEFHTYLDNVQKATHLNIEIYDLDGQKRIYPSQLRETSNFKVAGLSVEDIKRSLKIDGDVLHEVFNDEEMRTTKMVQQSDGRLLVVSYSQSTAAHESVKGDMIQSLKTELEKSMEGNEHAEGYYIVNPLGEVQLTSFGQTDNKVLDLRNKENESLLRHRGTFTRRMYSDEFSINGDVYKQHSLNIVPLVDGRRLIVIFSEKTFGDTLSQLKFTAMLITIAGVILLYFIGTVIMYLVDRSELTAKRVIASNQVNRMVVLLFVILLLLNGMTIIQVTKIIFFNGYETAAKESLHKYGRELEKKETSFKIFIQQTRDDAIVESKFIYSAMKIFFPEESMDKEEPIISYYTVQHLESLKSFNHLASKIQQGIDKDGYYEYYKAPKLFVRNEFDDFYENYVLEVMPGEKLHAIYRGMIFPDEDGHYIVLMKDIKPQMVILYEFRKQFLDLCRIDERELFISNITIYNDMGNVVLAQDGSEKFDSRRLKDELTSYPLWYWYQFKHDEMFRTVVKTIDGNYKEQYSLVCWSDEFEYYYVYNIPRKMIFIEIERLYNIYVSAIMFLLVGVFLTLGIRIKIKRKE